MNEYGVPVYCKIDIGGYDNAALKTLVELGTLPRFVSVETECGGDLNRLPEEQALETLETLRGLRFKKFKLVDQLTLSVLSPDREFYRKSFLKEAVGALGNCQNG